MDATLSPRHGVRRLSVVLAVVVLLGLTACRAILPSDTEVRHIPRAPDEVTATAGDAEASVSWKEPTLQYGSTPITEFTVTSSGGQTVTVPATETRATVTGLTNGTEYTFTVIATNSAGTSPPSAASDPVTPSP